MSSRARLFAGVLLVFMLIVGLAVGSLWSSEAPVREVSDVAAASPAPALPPRRAIALAADVVAPVSPPPEPETTSRNAASEKPN
jgi:hypothetical protein